MAACSRRSRVASCRTLLRASSSHFWSATSNGHLIQARWTSCHRKSQSRMSMSHSRPPLGNPDVPLHRASEVVRVRLNRQQVDVDGQHIRVAAHICIRPGGDVEPEIAGFGLDSLGRPWPPPECRQLSGSRRSFRDGRQSPPESATASSPNAPAHESRAVCRRSRRCSCRRQNLRSAPGVIVSAESVNCRF